MKHKNSQHIVTVKMVSGRQLLKLVHVANLHIKPFCKLVTKSHKKAVLIKHIISDLLAGIDMDFVIEGKEKRFRFYKISV